MKRLIVKKNCNLCGNCRKEGDIVEFNDDFAISLVNRNPELVDYASNVLITEPIIVKDEVVEQEVVKEDKPTKKVTKKVVKKTIKKPEPDNIINKIKNIFKK